MPLLLLAAPAAIAGYFGWGLWDSLPSWPSASTLLRDAVLLGVVGLVVLVMLAYLWAGVIGSGRNTVAGGAVDGLRDLGGKLLDTVRDLGGKVVDLVAAILGPLVGPIAKLLGFV